MAITKVSEHTFETDVQHEAQQICMTVLRVHLDCVINRNRITININSSVNIYNADQNFLPKN